MTFDPTKPVMTRDGRKARIVCADARGARSIIALVEYPDGSGESSDEWYSDGIAIRGRESNRDLINVEPETVEYWDVTRGYAYGPYDTLRGAKRITTISYPRHCILKRTRQGSRVIAVEVVEFNKECEG